MNNKQTTRLARHWALEQLDLPDDVPPAEARPRLLKQLSDMDFMPPGGWDGALRASGVAAVKCDLDGPAFVPARRGAEELLREEVEAFARRFFSLPPNARTAHYQELAERCSGVPAVAARLEALRPALDLPCELPADQPPEVAELLEHARRLAVLPRQQRAGRRLMAIKECRQRPGQCQQAAAIIQKHFARYAALDAALFRELALGGDREKLRQRIARQRRRALRKVRPPKVVTKTASGNPWWIGVAAVVIINVLRLSLTSTSHTAPNAPLNRSQPFSVEEREHHRQVMKRFVEAQAERNQAHELLRGLREQQSQGQKNEPRDALIRALENVTEQASGSPKKTP